MFYILLFLFLTYCILTHSQISLYYAFHGLTLWYEKMVPSLLPFMILSGTLVRMHLTEGFVFLLHPVLKRIFRCSPNVSYGIIMGFLCGFPMGARVTTDLLQEGKISDREGEFLLAFCNNIGPVYFCTFVIPVLNIHNIPAALFGMYGLPFLYGILLRYTWFRQMYQVSRDSSPILTHTDLKTCSLNAQPPLTMLAALDESIRSGIGSISMLCGYMILFNLLNLIPYCIQSILPGMSCDISKYIAPMLEITGGIGLNQYDSPMFILTLLPFGGLSCMAQTYSIIRSTRLEIKSYVIHKILLSGITCIYYIILFFCGVTC